MRRSVGSAAILAICLAYCSQGPFVFTDLDVNDPKARSLIETASRSELGSIAFPNLPKLARLPSEDLGVPPRMFGTQASLCRYSGRQGNAVENGTSPILTAMLSLSAGLSGNSAHS